MFADLLTEHFIFRILPIKFYQYLLLVHFSTGNSSELPFFPKATLKSCFFEKSTCKSSWFLKQQSVEKSPELQILLEVAKWFVSFGVSQM